MLSAEDHRAIIDLILRYATGIDTRDYRLFRSCFTDAVSADYGSGGRFSTGDELTAHMEELHRDLGATLHRNTNFVIAESPDGATARTYVNGLLMRRNGTLAVEVEGYYDDIVVRIRSEWKIRQRNFVLVRLQGSLSDGDRADGS